MEFTAVTTLVKQCSLSCTVLDTFPGLVCVTKDTPTHIGLKIKAFSSIKILYIPTKRERERALVQMKYLLKMKLIAVAINISGGPTRGRLSDESLAGASDFQK